MYTEWRDPYFFPEVVYSEERTKWIENQPFNKCFVHAERGGDIEEVEEVTIPVLVAARRQVVRLLAAIHRAHGARTATSSRGSSTTARAARTSTTTRTTACLGKSPAKHPYKDTLIELDDIVGRLVARRSRRPGSSSDTLVFITSDNGPEMETWPDAAYTPFRCSKGSHVGGRPAGAGRRLLAGDDRAGRRRRDGLFSLMDWFPTLLRARRRDRRDARRPLPRRRRPDRFLLGDDGGVEPQLPLLLARQHVLGASACGEYKMMLASTSDDDRDVQNSGGFSGVTQKYTYSRLYNLYLDPKEQHSYMIRKIPYLDTFTGGIGQHLRTFGKYPAEGRRGRCGMTDAPATAVGAHARPVRRRRDPPVARRLGVRGALRHPRQGEPRLREGHHLVPPGVVAARGRRPRRRGDHADLHRRRGVARAGCSRRSRSR